MESLKVLGNTASGSAQYSRLQLQTMIDRKVIRCPLVMVDLRQEPHGFLTIAQALNGEPEIAVGWFAERDWLNVAKDLPSIVTDESRRLAQASKTANLTVYHICTKTPDEDGIATAEPHTVKPTGSYSHEQTLVQTYPNARYLRLPSTDHCRPRDSEVDRFVAFEATLKPDTWLHFHCRAGDGRTTTFLAMHDIIHNALGNSLKAILTRQGPKPAGIGGVDLIKASTNQDVFDCPFSGERVAFMQNFYTYVCQAKQSGGFSRLTWSDWVIKNLAQT